MKTMMAAAAALLLFIVPVAAAPIEGVWKTESGDQAQFYGCGSSICIKLLTGPKKGTMLSRDLSADGEGVYRGSLFNPRDERTYSGSATLVGSGSLKLKGCALKIFCKTQTWTRLK